MFLMVNRDCQGKSAAQCMGRERWTPGWVIVVIVIFAENFWTEEISILQVVSQEV